VSVTKELASNAVDSQLEVLDDVRHQARRAIMNLVGCAVGGSRVPAVETALRSIAPYSGKGDGGSPCAQRMDGPIASRAERVAPLVLDLWNKLRDQSITILSAPRTERLIELLCHIDTLDDAGDIVKGTAPA
jgi:hypothetical protein